MRVQHSEERIEEVMAEEIRCIRTRTYQLQKKTSIGDGKRKEKAEEPKYSDKSVEINRTKQSNYNESKTENQNVEKDQQDIKSENCIKCDKYVETGVQCGYC